MLLGLVQHVLVGLILGLDKSKSTGPDEISAKMLKGIISIIVPKIFNLSIQTCSFPELWRCARIVPIPKEGTCHCQKIVVQSQFYHSWASFSKDTFTKSSPSTCLYTIQSLTGSGASTTTALLSSTHDCLQTLCLGDYDVTLRFQTLCRSRSRRLRRATS